MSTEIKDYKKSAKNLKRVYSNKSCDEYKMKGDITKHPNYDRLAKDIETLGTDVKNAPTKTITGVKDMFASLKKPIFKKQVSEFMAKPNSKNVVYATYFTIGYRYMMTTIMFIQTHIKATENGLEYQAPTVNKGENTPMEFVTKNGKDYDKFVEKVYQKYEKDAKKNAPVMPKKEDEKNDKEEKEEVTQEAAVNVLNYAASTVVGVIEGVFGVLNGIFRTAASLNPISLISACLSRSYDKKVEQYEKISSELEAAKKAYAEYKKLPASKRKERVESKYIKMIDKYNIKMANLKAKIDHYDTRASKGSDDDEPEDTSSKDNVSKKGDKDLPDSSSTVDTSDNKRDDLDF